MKEKYKISLCTVSMNRLYHLQQTLPQNIEDNASYENMEHVLLDYHSTDHMEEWVRAKFRSLLSSGRLKYYRTTEPRQFKMAHSKNMVSKLAGGDIVCLVDADNYTGKDYAAFVSRCFTRNNNIFLTTIYERKPMTKRDVLGRVCFTKEDFMAVEGFDEFMNNYGFDDYDFAFRLQQLGRRRVVINNPKYLNAISHSQEERTKGQEAQLSEEGIYIKQLDPARSEFLYLFNDNTYSRGIVQDHSIRSAMRLSDLLKTKRYKYQESLLAHDWERGTYVREEEAVYLSGSVPGTTLALSGFVKIRDYQLQNHLLLFHSMISNRNKMNANRKQKRIAVNNGCFGEGIIIVS
ncbi:glycosyltransferase family 2 protein [Foetidibacter luteolus]|uniref:glycosyltransferase family 2 protein n=1 Tax=Foetidibacter luteolus TaxID=2608880 RepID=UPI001A99ADCB|nr:glycosyltransferase family A protein [Foetidibacter luteolus]